MMKSLRLILALFVLSALVAPLSARAQEHEEKPKAEKAEKPEKAEGGEGEHAVKKDENGNPIVEDEDGPFYLQMTPMILPVIADNGPQQLITLIITLQIKDQDAKDTIKANMPRLQDAYLQRLYGALDKRMILRGNLVDVAAVKKRLAKPTEAILGPGLVLDILVQSVAQRRVN